MMTEQELSKSRAAWPQSMDELKGEIDRLADMEHDYGTAVYAMSLAAEAALNYMARVVGASGFQARCAGLDFVGRTMGMVGPFRIVDYDMIMFPHYEDYFEKTITKSVAEWVQQRAEALLLQNQNTIQEVLEHWEKLAAGELPFGFTIKEED